MTSYLISRAKQANRRLDDVARQLRSPLDVLEHSGKSCSVVVAVVVVAVAAAASTVTVAVDVAAVDTATPL